MNPTLFANEPAERAQALDQKIVDLLYGKGTSIFGDPLSFGQRGVLKALRYHTSSDNTITIRELRAKAGGNERDVKDSIRALRLNFGLPIGANRSGENGGYYFILSQKDMQIFLSQYLQQIRAELEVVRAVGGESATRELLGQLALPEAKS